MIEEFQSEISKDSEIESFDQKKYISAIESFQFLAINIRSDIFFAIGYLVRWNFKSTVKHWKVVKHFLRYLIDTIDYEIEFYRGSRSSYLSIIHDADWVEEKIDRKSITDTLIKLADDSIHWRFVKQTI